MEDFEVVSSILGAIKEELEDQKENLKRITDICFESLTVNREPHTAVYNFEIKFKVIISKEG